MIAASARRPRSTGARLLVVSASGLIAHRRRESLARVLAPGDVVIANDAATLPASLHGVHLRSREAIEVRLAGRLSIDPTDLRRCVAVVFGAGDHRVRTEDRPPPPSLATGDVLQLGPLRATVVRLLDHPRLAEIELAGSHRSVWTGMAEHGRPVQYAHVPNALALWDVWTPIAGPAVAFEPPSAGFVLDWQRLRALREAGIRFAALTHAAGLSSTGDAALDRRLPLDEPYFIPEATARLVNEARRQRRRIVAIGTTVVRALEHAARATGSVRPGAGVADQRIGRDTPLRVVDVLLTGTHEAGTSHYELLRAFAAEATLEAMSAELDRCDYLTHEFGDFVLLARGENAAARAAHRSVAAAHAAD